MSAQSSTKANHISTFFTYIVFSFALLSSIFQFYFIQIGGSYFSLTVLSIFLLVPFSFHYLNLFTWKPLFFIILIIIFQFFSFIWSIDLKLGLRNILGLILFIVLTTSSYRLTKRYPKKILLLFILYFVLLSVPTLLVILFRINPAIELNFLHSNIAKIFINPNILNGLFDGARNNIFDPTKAGGFFDNSNVAAAFLGINALISYSFSKAYSIGWLKIMTLFLIIGVVFTGSKAGVILIILLIFVTHVLPKAIKYKLSLKKVIFTLVTINIFFFLFLFLGYKIFQSNFMQHILETTNIRALIWNYGFSEFLKQPITGLGFGGWQEGFSTYAGINGINENFPPHNTLIYLWSQSGIFAVLFALLFMAYAIKYCFSLLKSPIIEISNIGTALFGAFLWTFIHGMGTNFGLVGELHMEVVLASLLGYSLARFQSYKIKNIDQ